MYFKPSMIHYTLSLSNIPFFNINPNGTKYIHQKEKVMLYSIFMKMQPCLFLYQNICFLLGKVFQIM
jgi:hypothetical protein